jgi:murein DD-endopeptidase MepM/ murein hydrolase activator NlpD
MNRRKGIIALIAATAGLGIAALPASAELHSVTVVLVTGERITRTVDVPPGTPVSSVQIPGITGTIKEVIDNGPVATPTPAPTQAVPVPTVPDVKPPVSTPTPDGNEAPGAPNRDQGGTDKKDQPAGQGTVPAPTQRNKRFRAGNINGKKLISELRRTAKARKRHKKGNPGRAVDGTPTLDNPTFSLALPGAAPIGVPNFFIDKFRIPPFLLPLYQAAGIEYGVRWEVLAAINEIETDYGRNLNVSSAGALGWMQFMPGTWRRYGVDANQDKLKDPYNPADAIFSAARYLKAAGAEQDLRKAIFAYNHADWYVDSVLMRARLIGGLPANLVGSLTGLTQGHFPVAAKATYADDMSEADAKRLNRRSRKRGNRALVVEGSKHRRGIKIFSRRGAPVVAVNDGRIVRIGRTKRLGRFVQFQDAYGNTYTYARLAKVAKTYPAPRHRTTTPKQIAKELALPTKDAKPTQAASATTVRASQRRPANRHQARGKASRRATPRRVTAKQRLFAHPQRPNAGRAGGDQQVFQRTGRIDGGSSFKNYFSKVFGLDRKDVRIKKLRPGSRIVAGTVLGRIGRTASTQAPHMLFELRPAGRGAPRIDPKPILDGWKLLESTAIYRAAGKNPFFGPDAATPSIGQILLMSKEALVQHVLANPRIELYSCGRNDVRTGQIDRRVLATLEFLAASGMRPTVTSLRCGHGFYTSSGNVSQHSSGNAVDIAKINGIPILGNQGKGSITELAVRRLLTLQGTMKPDQIITLMTFEGADNTLAMADHADHIHVGWKPLYGTNSKAAKQVNAVLKPNQWIKLIDRLQQIDNPTVRLQPSKHALKVTERASEAHRGE